MGPPLKQIFTFSQFGLAWRRNFDLTENFRLKKINEKEAKEDGEAVKDGNGRVIGLEDGELPVSKDPVAV